MIDDGCNVSDPWNDTYNTSTGTVKADWAEDRWALGFSIHALRAEETRRADHYSEHGFLTGGLIAAVVTRQTWKTLFWSLILRKKCKTENQKRGRWINEMMFLFVTLRQHAFDYNELSGLQNNFLFHKLLDWLWPDEDRSSRQDTQNNLLLSVPLLSDEMLPWTHRESKIHWNLTQLYFSQMGLLLTVDRKWVWMYPPYSNSLLDRPDSPLFHHYLYLCCRCLEGMGAVSHIMYL